MEVSLAICFITFFLHNIDLDSSSLNFLKFEDEKGQKQLFCLAKEVSANWFDFGLILGIKRKQLDAWDAQYRGDASKCWNRVMEHWLDKGGSRDYPATWEGLITLLNDLGFEQLAKTLKCAIFGPEQTSQ